MQKFEILGIEIVYIRASEGNNYIDPYFRENYSNAKENNLKVGFYHYVTARSEAQAIEQAEFFASTISETVPDCRLAMDFESFGDLTKEEINNISRAFLNRLTEITGKEAVIYSDAFNAREVFDVSLAEKYPIWVADYGVSEPSNNRKWSFWIGFQYTDRGEVRGINGFVDRDYYTNEIYLSDTSQVPKTTSNTNATYIDIRVTRGDTLSRIAQRYNTSYKFLAQLNNIVNPNLIFVGKIIRVPSLDNSSINDTSHKLYIVKRGDTLTKISREFGVSIQSIVELNNIANPDLIFAGEILRINVINK